MTKNKPRSSVEKISVATPNRFGAYFLLDW